MDSIKKIAQRVKVSTATVSRVLNGATNISTETRERVMAAARAGNYVGTVGRRAMTSIGLMLASRVNFHIFDLELINGILRGLDEQKFDLLILNLERDKRPKENYTQFFLRKGVRGVIIRSVQHSRHIAEAIAAEDYPHVVVAERFDNPAVNYIGTNSRAAARRAVEHLIQLGHRRISFAAHNVPTTDHADRYEGYKEALEAAGLSVQSELVVPLVATFAAGMAAANELMSLPKPPTAMFFADLRPAMGAMRRATSVGLRVPENLSIVAVDDASGRFDVYPTMTAVVQSVTEMGFDAGAWLARRVAHNTKETMRQELPARFEVNGTTGVPPAEVIRVLPDGTHRAAEA